MKEDKTFKITPIDDKTFEIIHEGEKFVCVHIGGGELVHEDVLRMRYLMITVITLFLILKFLGYK